MRLFNKFITTIRLQDNKRKKERKKELIISETHQKYYDLNTKNKKEQSIRFGSESVHLKESFLKALCGNNFMFFFQV